MIHEFVCYYCKVMFAAITKYFQWLGSMGPGMKIRFFWISKCSLKIIVIFEILQDVNWEAISKLVKMWCSFQIRVATVKSGGIAKLWIRYYGELCVRRQYSQCYRITQYTYTLMTLYECIIPQHFRIARLWYFIYGFLRTEKLLIF